MCMNTKNDLKMRVTLETPVDELASLYPESVHFLSEHNVRCIVCGEPLWCTFGELLKDDNIENPEELVSKLNEFLINPDQSRPG